MNQEKPIIMCDKCKHEFYLNAVEIHEAIVELKGVSVVLVYFTCPKCNKIYRVSIQDKRYYDLVDDLEKIRKKIRKNYNSDNKSAIETLHSIELKKMQRLAEHVKRVNKMFQGTFIFVASENNHNEKIIKYLP